jgi:hypothetical protein
MTEKELVRCRAVAKQLRLRLQMLKARLRNIVIDQDVLGIGGKNFAVLMKTDSDRVAGLSHCFDTIATQTFDSWIGGTCQDELATILEPLKDELVQIAEDAIAQHQSPAEAWKEITGAFDVTKDKIAGFAYRVGTQRDIAERGAA